MPKQIDRTDLATIVLGGLAAAANPYLGILVASGTYIVGKRTSFDENVASLLPKEIRDNIAILTIAREKLDQDLENSHLQASSLLFQREKQNNVILSPIAIRHKEQLSEFNLTRFSASAGWASADKSATKALKNYSAEHGPIKVCCSGINVAACAALKAFANDKIDLALNLSNASGREQAASIIEDREYDFMFVADAPMLLEENPHLSSYRRVFEISRDLQTIFKKSGRSKKVDRPTIYLYPNSSAEHQLRLSRHDGFEFPLPQKLSEEPILELADYPMVIDELMKPGDYIIAWEPLSRALRQIKTLRELPRSEFSLSISLYTHFAHCEGNHPLLDDFAKVFLSKWKHLSISRSSAWLSLVRDTEFYSCLKKGTGK